LICYTSKKIIGCWYDYLLSIWICDSMQEQHYVPANYKIMSHNLITNTQIGTIELKNIQRQHTKEEYGIFKKYRYQWGTKKVSQHMANITK